MFAHGCGGHFQSVSAVATVLSIVGVLVSAFVVYAISRHGVISAIRNHWNDPVYIAARSHGGWEYRISVIAIFIAAALAGAAGGLFMAGLMWQAGVAFVVGVGIMTFAIQRRSQILHRYRGW
jgi:hypothetical protein